MKVYGKTCSNYSFKDYLAEMPLSIGKLSTRTGVRIETIRYYEKAGILPEPSRGDGGHRVYSSMDVKRLFFVRRCRELGFTLKEITSLLELADDNELTCARVHDMTLAHAGSIRQKILDLSEMEKVLRQMAAECSQGEVPDCPIVDRLFEDAGTTLAPGVR